MGYTNNAFANIKNNSCVTLTKVTLYHKYSDDAPESMTWDNVGPGTTTPTSLKVGYNTGFIRTGQDYWWVQYTLPDGSTWGTSSNVKETLGPDDQGTTKTFSITGSILTTWRSDTLNVTLQESPNYNSWAVVVIKNNFPVAVSATLRHQYSTDQSYQHTFSPVAPGQTSTADQGFVVYFNTGFLRTGSDHWYITLKLDVPPYDNAPAEAFQGFSNANSDKACMLQGEDNGKLQTFSGDGVNFTMGIGSGSCTDSWVTWNGYNTLAFLKIQNQFTSPISTVVLTHQYSGDTTWQQTRGLILAKESSSLLVVEYNTGFLRTGMDYWNVTIYLENGTWYQNHKSNKECMLKEADAKTVSTFSVSADTFNIGLTSGACSDSIDKKGAFWPSGGRDVNQPYNKNAYIGSHNAYANFENGFWYAQQSAGLKTQLGQGATTLLLDIWYKDGDIYLMHQGAGVLQPFVTNEKLSTALLTVREFLTLQQRDPVTIIFEDRVEAQYQSLIKQAFVTSNTWSMVFNPDAYGVNQKGWPTLAQLFSMSKPIVVLTSNRNSPDFAYQWKYMSENVYGDASLDTKTWMNPRSESQPLNQLGLCALNHFPTWTASGFVLPVWIQRANTDNATALLKTMIDACNTQWHRYPNYINADFWEIPTNGVMDAISYLNQRLHGTAPSAVRGLAATEAAVSSQTADDASLPPAPTVLRIQHGRPILSDHDHSILLAGNWQRETGWIDHHFSDICPPPLPEWSRPLVHRLEDMVNLSLVLTTLGSIPAQPDSPQLPWIQQTARNLIGYLMGLEGEVMQAIQSVTGVEDELCAIPYFLVERSYGLSFQVTQLVKERWRQRSMPSSHDQLLLAGLAGRTEATESLRQRLEKSRKALASADNRSSLVYDLTHEILYLLRLGGLTCPPGSLAEPLEELLGKWIPVNQDLGAELLACYWLTGGPVNAASLRGVERLKEYSEAHPMADCKGCGCPDYKEQVHQRLTMVLALGATLGTAGEILNQEDSKR